MLSITVSFNTPLDANGGSESIANKEEKSVTSGTLLEKCGDRDGCAVGIRMDRAKASGKVTTNRFVTIGNSVMPLCPKITDCYQKLTFPLLQGNSGCK